MKRAGVLLAAAVLSTALVASEPAAAFRGGGFGGFDGGFGGFRGGGFGGFRGGFPGMFAGRNVAVGGFNRGAFINRGFGFGRFGHFGRFGRFFPPGLGLGWWGWG
jgi:hypothetical protein